MESFGLAPAEQPAAVDHNTPEVVAGNLIEADRDTMMARFFEEKRERLADVAGKVAEAEAEMAALAAEAVGITSEQQQQLIRASEAVNARVAEMVNQARPATHLDTRRLAQQAASTKIDPLTHDWQA
jgi:hypothetical protein